MASFFEKLKKGMKIEESIEEPAEEKLEEPLKEKIAKNPGEGSKRVKKTKAEKSLPKDESFIKQGGKLEIKAVPIEEEEKVEENKSSESKENWPAFSEEPEGQLAIDIYQTENNLIIQSAIAGVKPENLEISIEKDIITIKGIRKRPPEDSGDYFTQECFWGPFSREVISPVEVDPNQAEAKMKDGVLTIRIPKLLREKRRKIIVAR